MTQADQWARHVARVRGHFRGRDDFVEIDITRGVGWQPFCDLLGLPEPTTPVPWENRDPTLHNSEVR